MKEAAGMITGGLVLIILFILAITDIRKRKINILIPGIGTAGVIGLRIVAGQEFISYFFTAVCFVFVFLLISRVTGEQIGYGDAFVFGMTGAELGFFSNLCMMYLTFVFAFLGALFFIFVRKKGRACVLPLIPYIFCAYTCFFVVF